MLKAGGGQIPRQVTQEAHSTAATRNYVGHHTQLWHEFCSSPLHLSWAKIQHCRWRGPEWTGLVGGPSLPCLCPPAQAFLYLAGARKAGSMRSPSTLAQKEEGCKVSRPSPNLYWEKPQTSGLLPQRAHLCPPLSLLRSSYEVKQLEVTSLSLFRLISNPWDFPSFPLNSDESGK